MDMKHYCFSCMRELDAPGPGVCPFCGEAVLPETPPHQLRPGTVLAGEYLVGRALGQGGFGITYIGRDLKLERTVAIKEFYPVGFSNRNNEVTSNVTVTSDDDGAYDAMKKRFLDEARVLAKFGGLGGVVSVMRFFAENNTAYFVMEYLSGTDLRQLVRDSGPLRADRLLPLLRPVIRALEKIHAEGVIHRDISPDNLMLQSDGTLKLLDFGAARQMEGNKSLSVELKHGYAPVEQYSGGGQGPWTDVYALCATIYFCLTGVKPPQSVQRALDGEDELKKPSALGVKLEPWQEAAILRGLAVRRDERFQSMRELEEALFPEQNADTPRIDIVTDLKSETDAPERKEKPRRGRAEKTRTERIAPGEEKAPKKKKRGVLIAAAIAAALLLGGALFALARRPVTLGGVRYERNASYMRASGLTLTEKDLRTIAGMKKLRTLVLLDCTLPADGTVSLPAGLQSLQVARCDRFRLEGSLSELTELELRDVPALSGLDNLARCDKLKTLTISGCGSDASLRVGEIAALPSLTALYLEDLGGECDLSPLGGMTQLRKLSLSGNRIADPSFLSSLTALENVRLDRCGLRSLDALSALSALTSLSVNDNELCDLSPLYGAIDLTELHAARNRITELGGLSNCTRLKTVDLSGNLIADASILEKSAPYLVSLDLSGNRMTELSFLAKADALETLRADGNALGEADLRALGKLKTLSLRGCSLSSLVLPDAASLASVDLFDNRLRELSLPDPLPELKYLDVSYNLLEALRVPDTGKSLTLIASANPLLSLRFADEKEALDYLILDNCPDELLCARSWGNLSDALADLSVSTLAFRYPASGLDRERIGAWSAYRYFVGAAPLDRIADMKDALGESRLNLVDGLWELTESVRKEPVGLASPPESADYAGAPAA